MKDLVMNNKYTVCRTIWILHNFFTSN